jgi:hypothetical protein
MRSSQVCGVLAILLNCYIAFSLWGILGLILSIVLVPAAYFFIPLYMLFVFGAWLPLLLGWALPVVLGGIEMLLRNAASSRTAR